MAARSEFFFGVPWLLPRALRAEELELDLHTLMARFWMRAAEHMTTTATAPDGSPTAAPSLEGQRRTGMAPRSSEIQFRLASAINATFSSMSASRSCGCSFFWQPDSLVFHWFYKVFRLTVRFASS